MALLKLIPILWAVIWSVAAFAYAFRPGSRFRWGAGGRGRAAPTWLGRTIFALGAAYGLFWAAGTFLKQIGRTSPHSPGVLLLESINHGMGPILIDAFLGPGFALFAYGHLAALQDASIEHRAKLLSLGISIVAAAICALIVWDLVGRIRHLLS